MGSSEEHWIMNDNRYAVDQNGVHHGKCGISGTGHRGRRGTSSALDSTIKIDMKDPITGGGSATATNDKSGGSGTSSCSRIFEGPQVNIDVTSAGATVALGLMYLKTNNRAVAHRLAG